MVRFVRFADQRVACEDAIRRLIEVQMIGHRERIYA